MITSSVDAPYSCMRGDFPVTVGDRVGVSDNKSRRYYIGEVVAMRLITTGRGRYLEADVMVGRSVHTFSASRSGGGAWQVGSGYKYLHPLPPLAGRY